MCSQARSLALAALLLLAGAGPALADDGIGVWGGLTHFASNGSISSGTFSGESFTVSGNGLALGAEYEIALNEDYWAVPFLMLTSESASSDQQLSDAAMHTVLGAQFRLRRGEYVWGGHLAAHSESLSGGGGGSVSGSGIGVGFAGRWERGDGLFVGGQLDLANLSFPDGSSTLTSLQVQVGYRWGRAKGLLYNKAPRTLESLLPPADAQPPAETPAVEAQPPAAEDASAPAAPEPTQ